MLLGIVTAQAQHNVVSFFDEVGSARIQTEEFSQAHDTIVMVDHRIDDVALLPDEVRRCRLS